MKRVLRVVGWIALLLVLLLVVGVGYVLFDAYAGEGAAAVSNVEIPVGDSTILGYLAEPSGEGPYPAVLMVHEWWGLNHEIAEMADRLAAEGYVVLAVDTYRGSMAASIPGALLLRLTVPQERVAADMQAAFDWLSARADVDTARIGAIGFCYGGGVVMRHALVNPRLSSMVNLYGDTVDDPAGFGALLETQAPVLGIFGREDAQIPVTEVEAFESALQQTSIPHTVMIYDGVGHAFVTPATINDPTLDGGAAAAAWAQILTFFDESLRSAG